MAGELDNEVAVVTGAGRGVGRGIAHVLARAGAGVMVTSRTAAQVDETVQQIRSAGGRAAGFVADVEDPASIEALLAATEDALGPVTTMVNNAGGTEPAGAPFATLAYRDITAAVSNNLTGALLCCRAVLPSMLERGRGRIINVASGAGLVGLPILGVYGAAKAGLIRFSENLALEIAGRGVSVFAITPGAVRTQATEPLWALRDLGRVPKWAAAAGGPPHENFYDDASWQDPERAGELCRFLCSGAADQLSGHFFSAYDDEHEIVRQRERVERDQLHLLRLHSVVGLERATTGEDMIEAHRRLLEQR